MVWELASSKAHMWAPMMASVPCTGDVLLAHQDDEAAHSLSKSKSAGIHTGRS